MFNASDLYADFNPEDFTDEDDQGYATSSL
jgi:hypothetical protein